MYDRKMIWSKIREYFQSHSLRLNKNNKGLFGEDMAVQFLKKKEYRILERNYINKKGYRKGEIDIIAQDGKNIVFIEVKTRKRITPFDLPPEFFVDAEKFQKLERIAREYLHSHKEGTAGYRFDVVSIELYNGKANVKHIRNAFL